jgi:glyceraldehyde 3-phosphate dehydrogenase
MAIKVGINGFGRIGRLVFRAICDQGLLGKDIEVVAVNDIVPADNLAYLLKYDSTQGRFSGTVSSEKSSPSVAEDDTLVVNGHKIKCLAVREGPAALPWKALGVDLVVESTGLFTDADEGQGPPRRGREEGADHGPRQGRGHHDRARRQPHQVRSVQASHCFQRELHDQLPRAGGARSAEGRPRHRGRA